MPAAREFFDVDARLRHMDRARVEMQVLSWPTTFGLDRILSRSDAASFYREFNECVSALVLEHPGRFVGLAALPTSDPEEAASELRHARGELGLFGAVVPADAFLTPESARVFSPLLLEAQATASHLYVHPGPTGLMLETHAPVGFLRTDSASPRWLLEAGTRLSAALLTLETFPILEGCPDVSVHVAMLGGHLAWIADTLEHRAGAGEADARITPLRRVHVDTGILKPGSRSLALAVSAFGSDRILFGSDYPQFGTPDPLGALRSSGISETDLQKIVRGTAERLLARSKRVPGHVTPP